MNIRKELQEDKILYQESEDVHVPTSVIEAINLIPESTGNLLDVGCGTGVGKIIANHLGKNIKEYHGIEFNKSAIIQAKKNVDFFLEADIENLESGYFKENYFDIIMFNDVLEHLVYPELTLKNFLTYLKPDGYLILSIPNVLHQTVILNMLLNGRWTDQGVAVKEHLHFFTFYEIQELLESLNLFINGDIIGVSTDTDPVMAAILKAVKPWTNFPYRQALQQSSIYQFVLKACRIKSTNELKFIQVPNVMNLIS